MPACTRKLDIASYTDLCVYNISMFITCTGLCRSLAIISTSQKRMCHDLREHAMTLLTSRSGSNVPSSPKKNKIVENQVNKKVLPETV